VTLPQISSQSSLPAPVLSWETSAGAVTSDARSGASVPGSVFAKFLASAAAGSSSSASGEPGFAQPLGSTKQQTSPSPSEASIGSLIIPGQKNALAQVLALQSNAAPGSRAAQAQIPPSSVPDENASDSDIAGDAALSAATLRKPAAADPSVLPNLVPPIASSEAKRTSVVGSTSEPMQQRGAVPENQAGVRDTEQSEGDSGTGFGTAGGQAAAKQGAPEQPAPAAAQTQISLQEAVGAGSVPVLQDASGADLTGLATGDQKSAGDTAAAGAKGAEGGLSKRGSAKPDAAAGSRPGYQSLPGSLEIVAAPANPIGRFDLTPALPAPVNAAAAPSETGTNQTSNAEGDQVSTASATPSADSTASVGLAAQPAQTAAQASVQAAVQDGSVPATGGASATTQTDHLAFALSASAAGQTPDRASGEPVVAPNGAAKSADSTPAAVTPVTTAAGSQGALIGAGAWQPGPASSGGMHGNESRAASPETVAHAEDVHEETKLPTPDAVRTLRVQFTGDNDQRVDVRLGNTGGELRVSVRSTDATLTQTLQDHMPELTSRLGDQRLHTDVWMPREAAGAQSGGARSGGSSFAGGNPNGQGQQGRRQNGQNTYKPEWIDDLEANPPRTQNLRRN
jgi:hypothetical protein